MRSTKLTLLCTFLIGSLAIISCGSLSVNPDQSPVLDWNNAPQISEGNDQLLTHEQRNAYQKDAEILAVRYINERDSTQTEIPDKLINLLYNGLVHIATSDLSKAKEVTNDYQVHAKMNDPREITVYVDTTASWVDAWRDGDATTGNNDVDELISQFNFSVAEYDEMESVSYSLTTLRSDRAINGFAVGRLFENLNTVKDAGPDGIIGDGNDISVLFFDNYLQFYFKYGYGDCPAGCINRHIWGFNVYSDGHVDYIGEDGPMP